MNLDFWFIGLYILGLLTGVIIGWAIWRRPQLVYRGVEE